MASVSLSNVQKSYGAVNVLQAVDLDIADGEFVVLVGPSGCGKSTLLRIIAGLEQASAGEVMIGGRLVNDVPPKDRDIAMVFQSYALYPHMNVAANMGFSLAMRKTAKPTISEQVGRAAIRLGIGDFLDRRPRELSGGQRQRVAMGRAIVRDPKVFLFDEPLSNLDANLRAHMRAEIKVMQRELHATSIYVTHDQVEAMTMADRIVVMHGGVVQQIGAPLDLYDRPANSFVAGFLGSPGMNFLEAKISRKGDVVTGVLSDGQSLPVEAALPVADDEPVMIGLRPEHLSLSDGAGLKGKVDLVEQLGMATQFYVNFAGKHVCVLTVGRVDCVPGQQVTLSAKAAALHVFSWSSGERIAT